MIVIPTSVLAASVVLALLGALVCMALRLRLRLTAGGTGPVFRVALAGLAALVIAGYAVLVQDCRRSETCAPKAVSIGAAIGAEEIR